METVGTHRSVEVSRPGERTWNGCTGRGPREIGRKAAGTQKVSRKMPAPAIKRTKPPLHAILRSQFPVTQQCSNVIV
jgi:hypothetical protein